jgi:hypothetical protein
MGNPETQATLGTQNTGQINVKKTGGAIKNGQSRNTGNIWHTRHRTKKNNTQQHYTTQKTKKMSKTSPTTS